MYGKRNGAPAVVDGFIFRDNLMRHNTYGVKGDSLGVGSATLDAYFRGLVFEHNVLAGGRASQYPAGNYFPTVEEFVAGFVNAADGELRARSREAHSAAPPRMAAALGVPILAA